MSSPSQFFEPSPTSQFLHTDMFETQDAEAVEAAPQQAERLPDTSSIDFLLNRDGVDTEAIAAALADPVYGEQPEHLSTCHGSAPPALPPITSTVIANDTASPAELQTGPPRQGVPSQSGLSAEPGPSSGKSRTPAPGDASQSATSKAHKGKAPVSAEHLDFDGTPWHNRKTAYVLCECTIDDVTTTCRVYVERLTPMRRRYSTPILLIQGDYHTSDVWLTKPDGRLGWASAFLVMGYEVILLDLPPHGRSLYGPSGDTDDFSSELQYADPKLVEAELTCPRKGGPFAGTAWPSAAKHNKWPGTGRAADDTCFQNYCTSLCPTVASRKKQQLLSQNAVASVLRWLREPATVLIGHGTGATVAWLAADVVPQLVACILAVEPDGPPFGDVEALRKDDQHGPVFVGRLGQKPGKLRYGITDIPLTLELSHPANTSSPFSPPRPGVRADQTIGEQSNSAVAGNDSRSGSGGLSTDGEKREARRRRHIHLCRFPHAVVTTEASSHSTYDWATVKYLKEAGITVQWLKLQDYKITGNGHLCFLEVNSNIIAKLLSSWVQQFVPCARPQSEMLGSQMPLGVSGPLPSAPRSTPLGVATAAMPSSTDPSLKDVNVRYHESISNMTPEYQKQQRRPKPKPKQKPSGSGLQSAQASSHASQISGPHNLPAPQATGSKRPDLLPTIPETGFPALLDDQVAQFLHHTDNSHNHTGMVMDGMGGQQHQAADKASGAFATVTDFDAMGAMGAMVGMGEMSNLYGMDSLGGLDSIPGFHNAGTIHGIGSSLPASYPVTASLLPNYPWVTQQFPNLPLQQPLGGPQLGLLPDVSNSGFLPTLPTDQQYLGMAPGTLPLNFMTQMDMSTIASQMPMPMPGPSELAYRTTEGNNMPRTEPQTPANRVRETPPSPTPRRKAAGSSGGKAKASTGRPAKRKRRDSSGPAAGTAETGAEERTPKRMRQGGE